MMKTKPGVVVTAGKYKHKPWAPSPARVAHHRL
jgi:hypothetical protein